MKPPKRKKKAYKTLANEWIEPNFKARCPNCHMEKSFIKEFAKWLDRQEGKK